MKTIQRALAVAFLMLILLQSNVEALTIRKTEYRLCQNLLSELSTYAETLKAGGSEFPPPEFRVDPVTGEIPLAALVEQSLIKDVDYHKLVFPRCRYAVAPWALNGKGQNAGGYDIYCAAHGFMERLVVPSGEESVTEESLRAYFIDNCQKNGIDAKVWQKTIDAFDPDPMNLRGMNPVQRALAGFAGRYGPWPVLLLQLLVAISGAILFLKRSGDWKASFWAGVTAGASLWAGLQTAYLLVALSPVAESRILVATRRGLGQIFAMQEVLCFFLFIFFIVMVFKFRKYRRPVGPVVVMVFATLPGILFSNAITGLVGLLAFWLLLNQARKAEEP